MALEDDIRALEQAPLLGEVGRDALRLLAFSAEPRRVRAGTPLFAKGDRADGAFVVVSGEVTLSTGDHVPDRTVGSGALIGEMALIIEGTRPAAAVAKSDLNLLVIPRSLFRRMLEEYPDIAARLHARLSERVLADARELERVRATLGALDLRGSR